MKKTLKALLVIIISLIVVIGLAVGGFFLFYAPTLVADMSVSTGAVTSGASGYLYGLAEKGIPSENMTESVDISSVSQKVTNGLQHPIGDISHVVSQLDNTDYNVVYLQDAYSTWYYENDAIEQKRADDTYDWHEFLEKDYLPKVKEKVTELSKTSYSDKVVYCLYNECDNGVWFGETVEADWKPYGVLGEYNEAGAQSFFEAWKITYDFVKSINPDALIGGPGFYEYNNDKNTSFLTYCRDNDCLPDVMIYHELGDFSILFWQQHVKEYRELEKELGIDELPIIVTEYGRMCDNGLPGKMVQYITQIETTKVYADNAYWRLADNLNDVCADDNSPNSNWWLYRWYADMDGHTVESKYYDLFKSNFENAFIKKSAEYTSWGFMGIVSMTDDEDIIDVICGGREGSAVVKLKNMNDTAFKGKKVCVTVEESIYKGLSGMVYAPVVKQIYYTDVKNTLTIDLNDMDEANAYRITVVPVDTDIEDVYDDYTNDRFISRYEFEDGTLLGGAYTYNNWYAATGANDNYISTEDDLVGGMENEGDGVRITINVPKDGNYDLNIIYGNSNDGVPDENGKQNPDDRTFSTSFFAVDDNETELSFANTIKSEYTDCMTLTYELTKGEHTVEIRHSTGTIVLDSLLVMETEDEEIAVLEDADRSTEDALSYLVVAPMDCYYDIYYYNVNAIEGSCKINGVPVYLKEGDNTVYLMRGLNYIDTDNCDGISVGYSKNAGDVYSLDAECAELSDGAEIAYNELLNVDYITGISCNGGKADFNVNVEKAGTYALTILYSNNDEGGYHDYNVDLIERYVTITANGKSQDIFCRNTYSWDVYKTVTCYIELNEGENVISLSNSGKTKFNNEDTYAPYISLLSVNEICA